MGMKNGGFQLNSNIFAWYTRNPILGLTENSSFFLRKSQLNVKEQLSIHITLNPKGTEILVNLDCLVFSRLNMFTDVPYTKQYSDGLVGKRRVTGMLSQTSLLKIMKSENENLTETCCTII